MTQVTTTEPVERLVGRTWIVRLDAAARGSAAVRVSCSRPACAVQRWPSAAEGRAAAVAHLKAHLKAAPAPRAQAYCACKAHECSSHVRPAERRQRGEPWRCGGPVVLAVVTDREGRWWQAMECCARCAAATPGATTAATAPPLRPQSTPRPDPTATVAGTSAPLFSDPQPAATDATAVPAPRPRPERRRSLPSRIGQRTIPHSLRPTELRDELIALGDLFRSYQQREPDLATLADLHERKARAFAAWADAGGGSVLRDEAARSQQAAAAIRLQHEHRAGRTVSSPGHPDTGPAGMESPGGTAAMDCGPVVQRQLTVRTQWDHARSVLTYAADHAPLPGPQARLLTLMLTLRTAHTGTGNLVGQDITALGLTDPEDLIEDLTGCGWLQLPGTAGELLASRPENATPVTVPSLVPDEGKAGPFTFGRKMRPKLSGWAQKVISDKKLRKAKATAATRLLALTLATQTDTQGRLGPGVQGIALTALAAAVPVDPGELEHLVDQLTQADWLIDAALADTGLTGQLTERVLPLACPLWT
ncbi:hypothetical protein ABT160_39800 [Streptomyces sp. NPDC001941]|uniref:hypothetical protein n=1 Tax=Streptomyces sp. NPDC001941 TaxID=3154659 RepID=UPI003333B478